MTPPSDTYLSYVLSRPLGDIWNVFLLGLARIVPAIAIAPFLGGKTMPDTLKLGLGIAVVFVFLPFLVVHINNPLTLDITFLLLMIKEVIIGSIIGFIISMPFFFSQSAGSLIDHQRGSQSLQVMDPATQAQTSPTGTLYNNMMLIYFFAIGGPILFFDAIFTSYTVLPADAFLPTQFFDITRPLWLTSIGMITTLVTISLQLSAPALIAMLLSDLFLGIANRMAPQVQISFLMWSLKAYLGIGLVWASWWFILKQIDVQALTWTKFLQKLVESF